jgi:hypothetical protein
VATIAIQKNPRALSFKRFLTAEEKVEMEIIISNRSLGVSRSIT